MFRFVLCLCLSACIYVSHVLLVHKLSAIGNNKLEGSINVFSSLTKLNVLQLGMLDKRCHNTCFFSFSASFSDSFSLHIFLSALKTIIVSQG